MGWGHLSSLWDGLTKIKPEPKADCKLDFHMGGVRIHSTHTLVRLYLQYEPYTMGPNDLLMEE